MSEIKLDLQFSRGDFSLGLQCAIPEVGVTALLGASGCGKSSLIRLVAGLEQPSQGEIQVDGKVWFDSSKGINLKPQQRRVGVVFQHDGLFEHMSVLDNVLFGVQAEDARNVAEYWLNRTRMFRHKDKRPNQLSGGERKRVALARALAHDPDVLLLDEPFSALESELRLHLQSELLELTEALMRPVIIATHDLDEARYLADFVAVIANGSLAQFGAAANIFNKPANVEAAKVLGWLNVLPKSEVLHYPEMVERIGGIPEQDSHIVIHPHAFTVVDRLNADFSANVKRTHTRGCFQIIDIELKTGSKMRVELPNKMRVTQGEQIFFQLNNAFALPLRDSIL